MTAILENYFCVMMLAVDRVKNTKQKIRNVTSQTSFR